jgi:hypothetical protein
MLMQLILSNYMRRTPFFANWVEDDTGDKSTGEKIKGTRLKNRRSEKAPSGSFCKTADYDGAN